ncbi:MAG TPA: Asp-tRNA(Asn)/Glu-tRNA(Gln) amidotransferase subunit GatB [Candidatus Polarisedimenticolia bacterium]|nr:Asp-tRNA(Asn)/Glu-tRNA(Gln) amidotransferase subunit GatB [Candidatus Polarisedimenticolia bacterium]
MEYEAVIGLEVHCQLLTESKIFCGCSTRFGRPPNSNVCPVCLGMPGVLPVLNRRAVEYALRAALALRCSIRPRSIFARKNYFYPDLPKGYQISMYDAPLAEHGHLDVETPGGTRRVGITRVHMEEDAGKLLHEGFPDSATRSYVDFNRSGVPLIEIVSEPDLRTPAEAHDYYASLRALLVYLGVTDGNMEEGSLRCDANISLRRRGDTRLGTKSELKNLNSFKFVQRALEYEIRRQTELLDRGERVAQETRLYDPQQDRTDPMRSKEEAHDYRYFPEPDLPPLEIDEAWIETVRRELPELPAERRRRFARDYGLPEQDAQLLTGDRALADYFEEVARASGDAKAASNWIGTELLRKLNETRTGIAEAPLPPARLGALIRLVRDGTISGKIAKEVFEAIYDGGLDPAEVVRQRGLTQMTDEEPIRRAVEQVIAAHPEQLARYRAGKTALLGFFVGQVLKATGGRANPALVNRLLKERLDGS